MNFNSFKSEILNSLYVFLLIFLFVAVYYSYKAFEPEPQAQEVISYRTLDDTLHILSSENLNVVNPTDAIFADEVFLLNQIYQGLVKLDEHMIEVPDFAEHWTIDSKKTTYTFQLKDDQLFHNGSKVTASDVIYSIEYFLKHKSGSYIRPYFKVLEGIEDFWQGKTKHVKGIRKISDKELSFKLKHAYIPFLKLLSLPEAKILPASILKSSPETFTRAPIGSGPYRVKSQTDSTVLLEAFEGNTTEYENIGVKYFMLWRTEESIRKRLKSKDFDLSLNFVHNFYDPDDQFGTIRMPSLTLTFLGLNCDRFPTNNVLFRKSLLTGINRDKIVDSYKDRARPLNYLCPLNLPRHLEGTPQIKHNMVRAQYYLRQSLAQLKMQEQPRISIVVDTMSYGRALLSIIHESLDSLNIPYSTKYYSNLNWLDETRLLKENNLFIIGWYLDIADPDFYFDVFFNSSQSTNLMQYSNPTVDSLLKISYSSSQLSQRLRNYVVIEGLLIEDAPIVPLINNLEYIIYRKNLEGISINRLGVVSLELSRINLTQSASENFISHAVYESQKY